MACRSIGRYLALAACAAWLVVVATAPVAAAQDTPAEQDAPADRQDPDGESAPLDAFLGEVESTYLGPLLFDLFDEALLTRFLDAEREPDGDAEPAPIEPAPEETTDEDEKEEEELPESSLTILFSNQGRVLDAAERAKFYVHEPGERDDFVAWGHATRTAVFPGGTYDVVVRYENDAIEKQIRYTDVELIGDFIQPVAFDIAEATLTVQVTNGGRAIEPYAGGYTVRPRGRRGGALARKRPGETITVEPGYYDVEIRYRDSEGLKTAVLENHHVEGHQFESVEIGIPLAHLTVTLLADGERLGPTEGRWRIYEPGQRSAWLAERRSGELLGIEAGVYDVGTFVERDGRMTERWLVRVDLRGERHERVDMGVPRSPLRVDVKRDGRLVEEAWFTVYPAGNREASIVSALSGDEVELENGEYDIGCFWRDGGIRADRWISGHRLAAADRIEVELDARPAYLRVLPRGTAAERRASARSRLLVILDSSASMRARAGSRNRMEVLLPALEEVFRDISTARLDVGLRVYGAALGGQRDCNDSQLLVSPTSYDRGKLTTSLDRLQPNGRSPLAYSLEQAAFDLPQGEDSSIVVITSGVEGCGGEPCRVATQLLREGKAERINIIGFGVDRDQMRQLDCAGRYYFANTAGELKSALREIMRSARRRDDGRVAIFDAETGAWVTDGFLGDKIQVSEGRYDIVIRTQGNKVYEWPGIRISGNVEVIAGRRPPATR